MPKRKTSKRQASKSKSKSRPRTQKRASKSKKVVKKTQTKKKATRKPRVNTFLTQKRLKPQEHQKLQKPLQDQFLAILLLLANYQRSENQQKTLHYHFQKFLAPKPKRQKLNH